MTTVLIDAYALGEGSQLRGIGTYLRRIIGGMSALPDFNVTVLGDPRDPGLIGVKSIALRRPVPPRFRGLAHDLLLPRELMRSDSDVFLSPAQHPPRRSSMPWVQTLHDLIPLTQPSPSLERDRRRWMRVGPRLRHAAAIATVSRFSADEAIRHFGIDPRTLHVIPNGVDRAVFHPAPTTRPDPPYLLHVAAWGPHKGFPEALRVIAALAERGFPHRLVMAGPQDPWMLSQVRAVVAGSPRPDRVDVAGYVEDLASVYRCADALLMTSRCEGFGFPALEAMACGTPVIAFANSSLPEVVDDGGILVADGDVAAMVTAVAQLLGDEAARAELVERGLDRADKFRWADTIDLYAELLRSVAGR